MGEHKKYKPDWRIAADRVVIGDSVELVSLPGFHVKARRYSVSGAAEVQAAEVRAMASVKSEALKGVADAFDGAPKPEVADDAQAGLSADQKRELMITIMESASADMVGGVQKKRAMLRYGIHEHDFEGSWQTPTGGWVDEVMERPQVAEELLSLIKEKNLPLAGKTPPPSGTSQTGDSTESLSTEGQDSSPMEPTP